MASSGAPAAGPPGASSVLVRLGERLRGEAPCVHIDPARVSTSDKHGLGEAGRGPKGDSQKAGRALGRSARATHDGERGRPLDGAPAVDERAEALARGRVRHGVEAAGFARLVVARGAPGAHGGAAVRPAALATRRLFRKVDPCSRGRRRGTQKLNIHVKSNFVILTCVYIMKP